MPAKSVSSLPAHVPGAGVCASCRTSRGSSWDGGHFKWPLGGGAQTRDLAPGKALVQAVQGEKQEELPDHKYLIFFWEGRERV